MRLFMHLTHFLYLVFIFSCCSCVAFNASFVFADTEADAAARTIESAPELINDKNEAPLRILPNYKKLKKLPKTKEKLTTTTQNESPTDAYRKDTSVVSELGHLPTEEAFVVSTDEQQASEVPNNVEQSEYITNVDNLVKEILDKVPNELVNDVLNVVPIPIIEVADHENKETEINSDEIGLPDIITDIPTVTVTEIPMEIFEPTPHNIMEALVIDSAQDAATVAAAKRDNNNTADIFDDDNEIQNAKLEININDPGGGVSDIDAKIMDNVLNKVEENIPATNILETAAGIASATVNAINNDSSSTTNDMESHNETNETETTAAAEEVPIPVFSEWAQKQMEAEANKQQALELEQQVVNNSAQRKNQTNGHGKPQLLKLRSKNYASPDCGAKIIASNADASHTGAVLSSSKDEYMLSPCGNRIWFVVELCEAIQAQKIDLANFELFSSSPKNFTVAVSNRFPTRDWSNVGRFIAEDKRTIQSFDLHPHLFGKFVRVDIHSHYSKEHFCPVSLFRVFGTSEFEAFETENHPNDVGMDDFDDEYAQEQANAKSSDNIFKSASDAVIQMVKKAAEVLVKPTTHTHRRPTESQLCRTPVLGQFSCAECNGTVVERINNVLSCEFQQLNSLLDVKSLREHLLYTRVCYNQFGIDIQTLLHVERMQTASLALHEKRSYFLNILPIEYIGALCKLLTERDLHSEKYFNSTLSKRSTNNGSELHLTNIDKMPEVMNQTEAPHDTTTSTTSSGTKDELAVGTKDAGTTTESPALESNDQMNIDTVTTDSTYAENTVNDEQLTRPPQANVKTDATITTATTNTPTAATEETTDTISENVNQAAATPDVNIFNVPAIEPETIPAEVVTTEAPSNAVEASTEDYSNPNSAEINTETITPMPTPTPVTTRSDEDPTNWDSIDNLLTTTVASITAGGSAAGASAGVVNGNIGIPMSGQNFQHKLPNGAQSESVFIRLSNRIKALERNMSLSGQYLEELSRRYKKQVEELQQTLTQQSLTVRTLEDQSRRYLEQEELYMYQNTQLNDDVKNLTHQIRACIFVIIIVGAFVFLMLIFGTVYYRKLRRSTQEMLLVHAAGKSNASCRANNQKRLKRRKSFEDFSDHHNSNGVVAEKQRRPSEEAMLILKDCNVDATTRTKTTGDTVNTTAATHKATPANRRQRKISVCYGSNNNINGGSGGGSSVGGRIVGNNRRHGEKHSWPNSEQAKQQARQHLTQLEKTTGESEKYFDIDTLSRLPQKSKIQQLSNGEHNNSKSNKSKKKHAQQQQAPQLKRQESAPNEFTNSSAFIVNNNSIISTDPTHSDYDESLLLDEDDLDNFIPNSDLAYNEFMPDGPSGYQIVVTSNDKVPNEKHNVVETKKSRRLSSPAFFKSPFGRNKSKTATATPLTKKQTTATTTASAANRSFHSAHEATSWEWYRLRKNEAQQHKQQQQQLRQQQPQNQTIVTDADAAAAAVKLSPTVSLDSSSLSEINFPTNSTQNSFRILEEAILSSGESVSTTKTNCNVSGSSASSSGSNRSSTSSSSTKKKNRTFNRIFRNVF